ncbi:MAG: SurA N-terminal domain-containing protein [Synergistaceae bacterium]|jgi:hypothetical protein|nr:SurA N-terminal domain-containing protein [Synergistaceae bacterium]
MMRYLRKNVRSIMLIVVVLFVVSCFVGYGSYSSNRGGGVQAGAESNQDYAVAVVDGEQIMRSRIETEMFQLIQNLGPQGATISEDDYPSIRSNVLDQIAVITEIDKEVKARGIAITNDDVDAAVKDIENQFPTREIYMQEMERAGLDEKKLKENVQQGLGRQTLFEQVTSAVSTDVSEITALYDILKESRYRKPEGFMMNLANFSSNEAADAARKDIAEGKLWSEALEGLSADVLLYQTPYDTPALVPVEQMQEQFEFLKDLPMNEISKVTEVASGDFLLALKRSHEESSIASLDEVSADVEQMILDQKRQGLQAQFIQEMRARAKVEILDDSIFYKPEPITSDDVAPEAEVTPLVSSGDVSETPAADAEQKTIAEPAEPPAQSQPTATAPVSGD